MASGTAVAKLGITESSVQFIVPKNSKLYKKFADRTGKAVSAWKFELRTNPDRSADPWFVVRKAHALPGRKTPGVARGSFIKISSAFNVAISKSNLPAFNRFGTFRVAALELVEDFDDLMVFAIPKDRQPVMSRKSKRVDVEPTPQNAPEAEEAPVTIAPPAEEQTKPHKNEPVIIQPAPVPLNIERALKYLNKRKDELGSDLRFTIEEGGKLSAIHKIR